MTFHPCVREEAPPGLSLVNGVRVPMVGFGTAFFRDGVRTPETVYSALPAALDAGYRHIDTASMYGCERQVGMVLGRYFMDGMLTRDDVFVTTKVGHPPTIDFPNAKTQYIYDPQISAYDGVLQEFFASLENLGLGYVDLLLLHWPGLFECPHRFPEDWKVPLLKPEQAKKKRAEMWSALEHLYSRKLARSIGVSNFMHTHLHDLLPMCKVKPMMNQIELHPYLAQSSFVTFCQMQGIHLTAYSPLAGGKVNLVEDPEVVRLADQKGVSPGQIVLSWLLKRDIVVIPKSKNPGRMAENLRISKSLLTSDDVAVLDALDQGLHTCVDPSDIP